MWRPLKAKAILPNGAASSGQWFWRSHWICVLFYFFFRSKFYQFHVGSIWAATIPRVDGLVPILLIDKSVQSFWSKNTCWFKLLNYNDLLLFFVINDSKWKTLWVLVGLKQFQKCHFWLWGIVFSFFLSTFLSFFFLMDWMIYQLIL